jgi:hypothetical protein
MTWLVERLAELRLDLRRAVEAMDRLAPVEEFCRIVVAIEQEEGTRSE